MTQTIPPLKRSQKLFIRSLFFIFGSVSGLYLTFCIYLLVWQNRIIFKPSKTIEKTPQTYDLAYEELWLPVRGKTSIHGWWLPTQYAGDEVLLFLHGNSYNVGENLSFAQRYVELGFSVLLMDYRGYGLSGGAFPHEAQVYEDAQVMYDYLVEERRIPPEKIFVYGHSLGGAIAIELVRKNPVAGLITEGTFTSMSDIASYSGKYSFLPVSKLLHQRFESIQKLAEINVPTLFIHGTDDKTIPVEMTKQLHAQAIAPKKLLIVPGAGHNDVAKTAGGIYSKTILEFRQFARQYQAQSLSGDRPGIREVAH